MLLFWSRRTTPATESKKLIFYVLLYIYLSYSLPTTQSHADSRGKYKAKLYNRLDGTGHMRKTLEDILETFITVLRLQNSPVQAPPVIGVVKLKIQWIGQFARIFRGSSMYPISKKTRTCRIFQNPWLLHFCCVPSAANLHIQHWQCGKYGRTNL